jgi:predicted NUDIX family phosphoesterase
MSTIPMEHVLVVPTRRLREAGYFQGFTGDVPRYRDQLLDPAATSYRPRDEMEHDPEFKQLIPYIIFRFRSPEGDQLFQYTRGRGQGERRLHQLRSVGIGGHICSQDAGANQPYDVGMQRELDEEVWIETRYRSQCIGLINDDRNEVGRVHLGIVHLCDVESPRVGARESELLDAGFRPFASLVSERDQFETWSQICLDALQNRPL